MSKNQWDRSLFQEKMILALYHRAEIARKDVLIVILKVIAVIMMNLQPRSRMQGYTDMPRQRTPSPKSKYYVEHELYLTVIHYCKRYPAWCAELSIDPDTSKAINYDKVSVQTSSDYNPTEEVAIRRAVIRQKKDEIDAVAEETAGKYAKWLILSACYGKSYMELERGGMLLSRDAFYLIRRKFYYSMSLRI